MCEYIPVIIALTISALIFAVICLAVNYAFAVGENRTLKAEIEHGFHHTLLLNKSVAEDNRYLESKLRPYVNMAHKYRCSDADELEDLLKDLQDKLLRNDAEIAELKRRLADKIKAVDFRFGIDEPPDWVKKELEPVPIPPNEKAKKILRCNLMAKLCREKAVRAYNSRCPKSYFWYMKWERKWKELIPKIV